MVIATAWGSAAASISSKGKEELYDGEVDTKGDIDYKCVNRLCKGKREVYNVEVDAEGEVDNECNYPDSLRGKIKPR